MIIQCEKHNGKTFRVLFTWVCQWTNINNFCNYIDEIDMRAKEKYSLDRNCVDVFVKERDLLKFINAIIMYSEYIAHVEYDEYGCD